MERWQARHPVIVRGVKGRMSWEPEVMMRACRELGNKKKQKASGGPEPSNSSEVLIDKELEVLDCMTNQFELMSQHAFFRGYVMAGESGGVGKRMIKVKDWPPEEDFSSRLVRHNQDFLEMLPLPFYTLPSQSPLNLASWFPSQCVPPDLGPKTYVAYGRVQEGVVGDSVTKIHQDLSDAVNLMVHCASDPSHPNSVEARCGVEPCERGMGYGGAGAVWDIWPR